MKTLSQSEIQAAAILLIARDGQTTSLDVKNFLRSQNFQIRQYEVSQALIEFQDSNSSNVEVIDNGSYRIYRHAQPVVSVPESSMGMGLTNSQPVQLPVIATPAPSTNTQSSGRVKVFITPKNNNVNQFSAAQLAANFDKNDFVVFSATSQTPVAVYDANETRDHVRTHYARLNNVAMQDVRAKRVVNYAK